MREVVLDTETTGLASEGGDRIVEIGCIELVNHLPTGKTLHRFINPEMKMPAAALEIHGHTDEFLADKPNFAAIVDELLAFLGDSPLVIHNAAFDVGFLNAELARLPRLEREEQLSDVRKKLLAIARVQRPFRSQIGTS